MANSPQGYLHKKLDVKVLILFILARTETSLSAQELYEVAYQDDSLNYFTLLESLPELVASGHLSLDENGAYAITEKGRLQGGQVEDSLAVPVVDKVTKAMEAFQARRRREENLVADSVQGGDGAWYAVLRCRDGERELMTLSLLAPDETSAGKMAANLRRNANALYKSCMETAITDPPKRAAE